MTPQTLYFRTLLIFATLGSCEAEIIVYQNSEDKIERIEIDPPLEFTSNSMIADWELAGIRLLNFYDDPKNLETAVPEAASDASLAINSSVTSFAPNVNATAGSIAGATRFNLQLSYPSGDTAIPLNSGDSISISGTFQFDGKFDAPNYTSKEIQIVLRNTGTVPSTDLATTSETVRVITAPTNTHQFPGFSIEFVEVGFPGNADHDLVSRQVGGVDYTYKIGKYEITRSMIDAYNSRNTAPLILMSDLSSFGGNGPNKPATGVSWNSAARFTNWLNTSQGYPAAYKFTSTEFGSDISLWNPEEPGYDPTNRFRNSEAKYFLPSEDEWYKAAFFDPSLNEQTGGYWDYPTGSNTIPTAVSSGMANNTAVFDGAGTGPADVTNAGGLSPMGTMAQGGNAAELLESALMQPNDDVTELRGINQSQWDRPNIRFSLLGVRPNSFPSTMGFRVASRTPASPPTPLENFNQTIALEAPSLSGVDALPNTTPFNDGVSNLLKYAFNMNLAGPDSSRLSEGGNSGLPTAGVIEKDGQTFWRVEFVRRKNSGLIYTPLKSETLNNFIPMTGDEVVEEINTEWERVTIDEPCDPQVETRCFSQVRVEIP